MLINHNKMTNKNLPFILVAIMIILFVGEWIVIYNNLNLEKENQRWVIFLLEILNPWWLICFYTIIMMLIVLIVNLCNNGNGRKQISSMNVWNTIASLMAKICGPIFVSFCATIISLSMMQNYIQIFYNLEKNVVYNIYPHPLSGWIFAQFIGQSLLLMVGYLSTKNKEYFLPLDNQTESTSKTHNVMHTMHNILICAYVIIMVATNLGSNTFYKIMLISNIFMV